MYILGISAFYHDSAACLIHNGEIIAAAQEERFTRKKNDAAFPVHSINYCLKEAKIKTDSLNFVIFYDKPFLKFERLIETYLAYAPRGLQSFIKSMPIWIKDKLFQKLMIIKELEKLSINKIDWKKRLLFSEHHLSHAASAFYASPFDSSAVLTMDGVGEWTTTSIGIGTGNELEIIKEINFPHSIGLLYSAITYYIGFKVNSGEYKVMGLAPYGQPIYVDVMKNNLIDIKEDGSFFLDMSYFNYTTGLTMTNSKLHKLLGGEPRKSESPITQREMDLAASIQAIAEEVIIKIAKDIKLKTGQTKLCLAGGVALNCVANGKLLKSNIFEEIWIQPAAGDSGGAIGAAYVAHYKMLKNERRIKEGNLDEMKGGFLGPEYLQSEIIEELDKCEAKYIQLTNDELIDKTARAIADGYAIGWMNGRMEFGPRSLGARSILADPRSPEIQKLLNLKIKYRESFRPFAPSILKEDLADWFDLNIESPYMLLVAQVNESKKIELKENEKKLFGIDKLNTIRSSIPSVTHVDYSSRIQTVDKETNSKFYKLINRFKEITGCPILVNTSFNVRGEPIVCTPTDAFKCFMGTELDILVIGNLFLDKKEQLIIKVNSNYKDEYELD